MVRLKAFIIGTVMHLFWGYPNRRNYAFATNILKGYEFLTDFTFCSFELTYIGCSEIAMNSFLVDLPFIPKSLCNHELSAMSHHCKCCHHCLSTGLIIET